MTTCDKCGKDCTGKESLVTASSGKLYTFCQTDYSKYQDLKKQVDADHQTSLNTIITNFIKP